MKAHSILCTAVYPSAGVTNFDASITGNYLLKDPSPKLMLLGEFKIQSGIQKKMLACREDWIAFLDQHGAEPPFKQLTEPNSLDIRYRSEPCAPLQFSLIGSYPGARSSGDWVDVPYSGLRIDSSGANVLLGVIPYWSLIAWGMGSRTGSPFHLEPPAEIEFVRDSTYIVGTFRISSEIANTPQGTVFSTGSSLVTFDHPKPGVHIYSLKIRYLGMEKRVPMPVYLDGQFIAYQVDTASGVHQ
jgi:hypothetical protein